MGRRLVKLIAALLTLALIVGLGVLCFSSDAPYTVARWMSLGRFEQYDSLIEEAARKHGVDPLLLKAVVWRESQFHPHKTGRSGERGLMQVGEPAALDWVRINKVESFVPEDLYSPFTNLEVGTWYLARALRRWSAKDDAIPFALAEYNAGKSRVDRWIAAAKKNLPEESEVGADPMRASIDIASTRAYVESIMARHAYYQKQAK